MGKAENFEYAEDVFFLINMSQGSGYYSGTVIITRNSNQCLGMGVIDLLIYHKEKNRSIDK